MYQSSRLRASLLGHRLFYHFLSNFILTFYENDTKILETLKTQNSLWQISKVNKLSDVSIHLKFPPSFTFSLLLNKATLHLYLKKITRFFIYKCRVFRWIWLSEKWGHGCAEGTCLELFFAPTNSVQSELVNFNEERIENPFSLKIYKKICEIIAIIIEEHISE